MGLDHIQASMEDVQQGIWNGFVHDRVTESLSALCGRTGRHVLCLACSSPTAGVKQTLHLAIQIVPQRYKSYVQWSLLRIFLRMTLLSPASKNLPWKTETR